MHESVKNRLKARFVKKNDTNYPLNALHMFAEKNPTLLHNKEMLMSLTDVLYKIEVIDAILGKYPKIIISSA